MGRKHVVCPEARTGRRALARVVAIGMGRGGVAPVVNTPPGLSPSSERPVLVAAQRLASVGRISVWLVGVELRATNVRVVRLAIKRSTWFAFSASRWHPPSWQHRRAGAQGGTMSVGLGGGAPVEPDTWIHTLANPIRLDLFGWPSRSIGRSTAPSTTTRTTSRQTVDATSTCS